MSYVLPALLQQYIKLTEFLGYTLGPDYEVALHDLTNKNSSLIAIANNHISGREIGAPLTQMALSILKDRSYETSDYKVHYCGASSDGRNLRSSTFFIKQNGRLIGMLCINFDDTRYRTINEHILHLCHPDRFIKDVLFQSALDSSEPPERFPTSTENMVSDAVNHVLDRFSLPADRLTAEERQAAISELEKRGIFLLKGAVKDVATMLHCSQASVYRYLYQLKNNNHINSKGFDS